MTSTYYKMYMVVGLHDDGSRFADSVLATSGEEAERLVIEAYKEEYPGDYAPDIAGTVFINASNELEIGS